MTEFTTRADMLRLIPPNAVVAEIGVFAGEFSREIIARCNPRRLFLVDPWAGTYGSGDKDGYGHREIPDMGAEYLRLASVFSSFQGVRLVRHFSHDFLTSPHTPPLDAVYLDGDHSYEAVSGDLVDSMGIVKHAGWIMGHDYYHQVERAVSDFCREHGQEVVAVAHDRCPSFAIRLDRQPDTE
jgi:hypothetical protein